MEYVVFSVRPETVYPVSANGAFGCNSQPRNGYRVTASAPDDYPTADGKTKMIFATAWHENRAHAFGIALTALRGLLVDMDRECEKMEGQREELARVLPKYEPGGKWADDEDAADNVSDIRRAILSVNAKLGTLQQTRRLLSGFLEKYPVKR